MADFLRGRRSSRVNLPPQITEFFLCKEFGWKLEYVRSLPMKDYATMVLLLDIQNRISNQRRQEQLAASGVKSAYKMF